MRVLVTVLVLATAGVGYILISWSEDRSSREGLAQGSRPIHRHQEAQDPSSPERIEPKLIPSPVTPNEEIPSQGSARVLGGAPSGDTPDLAESLVVRARAIAADWNSDLHGLDLTAVGKLILDAEMYRDGIDLGFQYACVTAAMKARRAGLGYTYGTPDSNYMTLEIARAALSPMPEDYVHVFSNEVPPRIVVLRMSDNEKYLEAWGQRELARSRIGKDFVQQLERLRNQQND